MPKEVVLDSSVFVSAFVKGDRFRSAALRVFEKVFLSKCEAFASVIGPVEVCGVIARRAGVDEAASVKRQLDKWESMGFIVCVELKKRRSREAAELALKLRLKGMDAIVVQRARERKAALVTFDEEMAEKSRGVVEVSSFRDFEK
jgi:predicted nucleic acid-binding protein